MKNVARVVLLMSLSVVSHFAFGGVACDAARQSFNQTRMLDNGTEQMRQFIEQQRQQTELICSSERLGQSINNAAKNWNSPTYTPPSSSSDDDDSGGPVGAIRKIPGHSDTTDHTNDELFSQGHMEQSIMSHGCEEHPGSKDCCWFYDVLYKEDLKSSTIHHDSFSRGFYATHAAAARALYDKYCSAPTQSVSTPASTPIRSYTPSQSASQSAHQSQTSPLEVVTCVPMTKAERGDFKEMNGEGRFFYRNDCSFRVYTSFCIQQREQPGTNKYRCTDHVLSPGQEIWEGIGHPLAG